MLLSSGCRVIVEGWFNVQSSSTTHNSEKATSLDGICTFRVSKFQRIFIFGQLKVFPLFHYSVIPYYRLPCKRTHTLTHTHTHTHTHTLIHLCTYPCSQAYTHVIHQYTNVQTHTHTQYYPHRKQMRKPNDRIIFHHSSTLWAHYTQCMYLVV